jgi:hypothetical protein
MAETLKSFGDGIERVMNRSKSIDQSLTHASTSVSTILASLVSLKYVVGSIEAIFQKSSWGKSLTLAFNTAKMDATELLKQQNQALSDFNEWRVLVGQRIKDGEITNSQARMESAELREQLGTLRAQVAFKSELSKISKGELVASGAFLATLTSAYNVFTQTGRVLIESNASLGDRLALTRSILNVQRQLGSEMHGSVDAARDLVDYGYDLDAAFESTLKLVVQMKDGLGVSTKLGAELAVVYERQLRTSARDVADAMARVVNDTSVAADEAGRLAVNIGRAVAMMKPGANADLAAVNELVGRYEGALKSLGGQFGGFEELLSKLTTSDGLMQAGILGVGSPEFLRSKDATKQVMDSFASYAKNFLGNTAGWERALRLQSLAEMFGTTASQVNLMMQAVEQQNNQRQTSITIEQRYKDQVFATAEVVNRLKNSLVALAQQAVLPLIEVATAVLRPVAEFLTYLQKMPGTIYVAGAVLAVGAVAAVSQIARVSVALYTMATAAHVAAQAVHRQAAANALSALTGTGAAAAVTGPSLLARSSATLGRFIGIAAGPIIAGAVALAIGAAIGFALTRAYDKFTTFDSVALKNSDQDAFKAAVRRFSLAGDIGGVKDSMSWAQKRFTETGMTPSEASIRIANIVRGLDIAVGDMKFAKASAQHSLGVDPDFDQSFDKMNETQKELIKIAEAQHTVAVESVKVQKDAEKKEVEYQFQQRMDQLMNRANNIPRFENIYNPKK